MGIQGLSKSVIRRDEFDMVDDKPIHNLSCLSGKTMAIDISIEIYRAVRPRLGTLDGRKQCSTGSKSRHGESVDGNSRVLLLYCTHDVADTLSHIISLYYYSRLWVIYTDSFLICCISWVLGGGRQKHLIFSWVTLWIEGTTVLKP